MGYQVNIADFYKMGQDAGSVGSQLAPSLQHNWDTNAATAAPNVNAQTQQGQLGVLQQDAALKQQMAPSEIAKNTAGANLANAEAGVFSRKDPSIVEFNKAVEDAFKGWQAGPGKSADVKSQIIARHQISAKIAQDMGVNVGASPLDAQRQQITSQQQAILQLLGNQGQQA